MSTPPKKIRGFTCESCVGVRLHVVTVRRVSNGLVVRYLRCSMCGRRRVTEERFTKTRRTRPPNACATT